MVATGFSDVTGVAVAPDSGVWAWEVKAELVNNTDAVTAEARSVNDRLNIRIGLDFVIGDAAMQLARRQLERHFFIFISGARWCGFLVRFGRGGISGRDCFGCAAVSNGYAILGCERPPLAATS